MGKKTKRVKRRKARHAPLVVAPHVSKSLKGKRVKIVVADDAGVFAFHPEDAGKEVIFVDDGAALVAHEAPPVEVLPSTLHDVDVTSSTQSALYVKPLAKFFQRCGAWLASSFKGDHKK